MLPLSLLRAATGSPLLVELKGGDTYNGRLTSVDPWMNMNLSDVICTAANGTTFTKLPQGAYIRGSAIKYLRLPPTLLETAAVQEAAAADERRQQQQYHRGGGGGGGRGRGGGGRGGSGRGRGGRSDGRGRGGGRGRGRGGGRGVGVGAGRAGYNAGGNTETK